MTANFVMCPGQFVRHTRFHVVCLGNDTLFYILSQLKITYNLICVQLREEFL